MNWCSHTKPCPHAVSLRKSMAASFTDHFLARSWLNGKRLPHGRVNLTRLYCQFYEQDAGGQNDRAPSNVRGLRRLLVMVQARIQTLAEATCAKRRQTSGEQFFLPLSQAKPARGKCCSVLPSCLGSVAICNRLDTDPLNSGNSRSNLWFVLQSDSELGPDWEGRMTHVSMIGKHDYKEKCGLVLVAQECVLSQSTNEALLKKGWEGCIKISNK